MATAQEFNTYVSDFHSMFVQCTIHDPERRDGYVCEIHPSTPPTTVFNHLASLKPLSIEITVDSDMELNRQTARLRWIRFGTLYTYTFTGDLIPE